MNQAESNPFPYSDTNKRYRTFDHYLRGRFGRKCARITLDAGFSCPHITLNGGGCVYCTAPLRVGRKTEPIARQFEVQRAIEDKKWPGSASIAYFNEGTNTLAPARRLRALYEEALSFPDVVGLAIATRADAIDAECFSLLRELHERTFLIVELGLQSVHDATARRIGRGHDFARFLETYRTLDGLNVCVHLINSLPGEDAQMMIDSARTVGRLRPMMVKIHMLYVTEGTPLAADWRAGGVPLMSREEYVDVVASQLEVLPPQTVIGRLTGDGERASLLAPEWTTKKLVVLNEIDKLMYARGAVQGCKFIV